MIVGKNDHAPEFAARKMQIARHHKTEEQSIPQNFNINVKRRPRLFNEYKWEGRKVMIRLQKKN
jgi:hypothetical protein